VSSARRSFRKRPSACPAPGVSSGNNALPRRPGIVTQASFTASTRFTTPAAPTRRDRRALGYVDLPASLDQALREMEKSDFVADILGEHVFEFFLRNKWREWHDYQKQITPWELQNNLSF